MGVPLLRRDGEVFGTLCAFDPRPSEDLEEHLETFELLADLIGYQLEAEQLHEERERFLGVLGHDLRSPLQAIQLSAELASIDPGLGEMGREALQRVHRAARRIEDMVGDLLDFTRGRFGEGLALDRRLVDVGSLIREAVEEKSGGTRGRRFEVRLDADLGTARWDSTRVSQLLANLLSNALAHGTPGTAVTVSADGDADEVVLEVHNLGPAIPPDALAAIFQPFSQLAETEAGSRSGLGLGLYIVSLVAQAHGGGVTVTSQPEDGTRFRVRLPR